MSLPAELTRGDIGGGSGQLRTRARRLAGARSRGRGRGSGRDSSHANGDGAGAGAPASSGVLGGTRMMRRQGNSRRPRKVPPLKPLSLPTFLPAGTPITTFSASAALEEQYVAATTAGTGDFGSRYMRLRATVTTALDALPVDDGSPRSAAATTHAAVLHDNRTQLGILCFKVGVGCACGRGLCVCVHFPAVRRMPAWDVHTPHAALAARRTHTRTFVPRRWASTTRR